MLRTAEYGKKNSGNSSNNSGKVEKGKVLVSRFVEACAMNEALAEQFMECISRWDEVYCIVEVYEKKGLEGFAYNDRIAHSIIENGISWFVKEEIRRMRRVFRKMNELDSYYYDQTGLHFKGYVNGNDFDATSVFLADFQLDYDRYMSGGHQDVLVAVA